MTKIFPFCHCEEQPVLSEAEVKRRGNPVNDATTTRLPRYTHFGKLSTGRFARNNNKKNKIN
jgi:hypothetical protein